jgi:hypothetical protein
MCSGIRLGHCRINKRIISASLELLNGASSVDDFSDIFSLADWTLLVLGPETRS